MLETAHKLGDNLLPKDRDTEEGILKFLQSQTITPYSGDLDSGETPREVIVNLNTEKDQIELRHGKELMPELRNQFMGFELMNPRGKKIYFSTNNYAYHLLTVTDLIKYISENEGYIDTDLSSFKEYLKGVQNQFCTTYAKEKDSKQRDELRLNLAKLEESYGEAFQEKIKKNPEITVNNEFKNTIIKKLFNTSKDLNAIDIFSLTIDGRRPHESGFKYQKEYLKIVEYERLGRFFPSNQNKSKKQGVCSFCSCKKNVTGKIDIPTKFFITDKITFFENLNNKNAYRSFALCQKCYQNLMTGINHIQEYYSDRLFNYKLKYFLIPKSFQRVENLKDKVGYIQDLLNTDTGNHATKFEQHQDLLEEIQEENLSFDFLFYWDPQAEFNVAEVIPDVSFNELNQVLEKLDDLNRETLYSERKYPTQLSSIYWLLFPNKNSHSKPDPSLYRKELLQYFHALLKGGSVSYQNLISKATFIIRKAWFKNDKVNWPIENALSVHILLELFNKFTNLYGIKPQKESTMSYTEIPDEKIREFFETHPEIYDHSPHRQGLVLLGTLMNQIVQEQDGKSSTILEKINFDGMPPRKMLSFSNEISKYLNIYDIFNRYPNYLIQPAMRERLHNIENTDLTKDEIVFYLLTGVSLSNYLRILNYKSKQKTETHE